MMAFGVALNCEANYIIRAPAAATRVVAVVVVPMVAGRMTDERNIAVKTIPQRAAALQVVRRPRSSRRMRASIAGAARRAGMASDTKSHATAHDPGGGVVIGWSPRMAEASTPEWLEPARRLDLTSTLLATTVHEVNNALQVISGSAEMLTPASTPDIIHRRSDAIGAHARRASALLAELSAFAKDDSTNT